MFGVRMYMVQFVNDYDISEFNFWLLVFSTVIIAAGGNIINDYFDVRADRVNRPSRVIIGKFIKRRWAIVSHWCFNSIAFCIALYLSWYYQSFVFILIHVVSITLLWWYSVSLKKKPFIGNFVVSLLTVLVIYLTQVFINLDGSFENNILKFQNDSVFNIPSLYIVWIFMGMAFLQNFAREIIKDAEDVKGDLVIGAKTLAMILGNTKTIKLIGGLLVLYPIVYFSTAFYLIDSFDWLKSLPITLSACTNFLIFVFAFFTRNRTSIKAIKNLLKISMFFGIIYLFLPQ